ncbi:MAG TPA: sugar ABC transporter ATP-binding protein [Phycisphaerales bacterium]|nr:sugar ABC transporter ATP-binding protein [Phycisphaerales bacterium]
MLLRATNISKAFGPTRALDGVSVGFERGEIHALMGENGAGKSTLGKVIAGLHRQDEGTVEIAGDDGAMRTLRPGSLDDAFDAGIRLVHQELAQCANLSVAENLCLHALPRTRLGTVDFAAMHARARRLLAGLEPGIDVAAPLGSLSPGHRQIVQIAAALDEERPPRAIVFDEPTSSLSIAEVERLLEIIRGLAKRGITCIYVSHRMGEIFAVCDRVTVLRDGRYVATSKVKEIDEPTLVEQMIGRKVPPPVRRARPEAAASTPPALEVRNLSSPDRFEGVSFTIAPGEILGVGGLVGAGRSELLDAVFGLDPRARGTVIASGVELCTPTSGHSGPRASIGSGLGYVPEDRKLQGLFFQLGIGENIVEPFMARLAGALGLRSLRNERSLIAERMREFEVKAAGPAAPPGSLSGGNQQKLLLARWMGHDTRVLLLDEPTRGIDVGTKAQIYTLVRAAAERGLAVLLVSSEMPELLALSDRIIVLSDGQMTGELRDDAMTQASILKLATAGH